MDADTEWEYGFYRYEVEPQKDGAGNVVTFVLVQQLNSEDYSTVEAALWCISRAVDGVDRFLRQSLLDLNSTFDRLSVELTSRENLENERWATELDYRVLNVSAAIVMYNEHVRSEVSKVWKADPAKTAAARLLFAQIFDSSFAYRVIYYLRNALVHTSSSLRSITLRIRMNDDLAHIALHLDKLAFARTEVKTIVRSQVAEWRDDIDLVEYARAAAGAVAAAQPQLVALLHPELPDAVALIRYFIAESHRAGGGGPHFHRNRPGDALEEHSKLRMTDEMFYFVRDWKPIA